MDRLVDALGEESSLILFPEGTRGSGEQVGAFRSGLYHLCRRKPGLELVPVYMENLNRILPKGEVLPVPLLSSVTFGPPMQLQPAEDKRKFLERARQALVKLRPE
jgi:1-acyl-sn-glycerol-3-phosphate acyltransferase